uniref:Uncharacterized protein n=1 Tax=Ixodes ricinus TaxID=34613 RepID=A0A6B0UJ03_IXORI
MRLMLAVLELFRHCVPTADRQPCTLVDRKTVVIGDHISQPCVRRAVRLQLAAPTTLRHLRCLGMLVVELRDKDSKRFSVAGVATELMQKESALHLRRSKQTRQNKPSSQ